MRSKKANIFTAHNQRVVKLPPANFQYHDTYFVVAHFHYTLVVGGTFPVFSAVYLWLPKWTGHMYNERLAKLHFWLTLIAFNLTFMPQHFLGLAGMPRRIPDYAIQFADFNMISSIGAFILGSSQLIFLTIVIRTIRGGENVTNEVWEGAEGTSLEWTVASPAPYHTFQTAPEVK